MPIKMPGVLLSSLLFSLASSTNDLRRKGMNHTLQQLVSRLACKNTATVLSLTSDNNKPTSAARCGATCCACHDTARNRALNFVFSQAVVGCSQSLRREWFKGI